MVIPQATTATPPHTVGRSSSVRFDRVEFRVVHWVVIDPPEVAFLIYVIQPDPCVRWETNEKRSEATNLLATGPLNQMTSERNILTLASLFLH